MRSLVLVYCIFCLFPLPVASAAVLDDFVVVVVVDDDLDVDLSVLPLLASDDFLVSELRVDVDILLAYLFTCFLLIYLSLSLTLTLSLSLCLYVSCVCMFVVYALLPAERIHNMISVFLSLYFVF